MKNTLFQVIVVGLLGWIAFEVWCIAHPKPALAIAAKGRFVPDNLPHELTGDEFVASDIGPEEKPIAIAPPCKGNAATCEPQDRMWSLFPGTLEPGWVMTPNGLIYAKRK